MNAIKPLFIGAVALSTLAVATPAEARDHRKHKKQHHSYYSRNHHPRVIVTPRYYRPYSYYNYNRPYYYSYPREYYYGYPRTYYRGGPSITFSFGGSRYR